MLIFRIVDYIKTINIHDSPTGVHLKIDTDNNSG